METTRREFLQASALASLGATQNIVSVSASDEFTSRPMNLDAFAIARDHKMQRDIPGPTFFEGMLLGNGDVGVCAVVRPDALGIHIGKNDCWDIRVSEYKEDEVLSFSDLLDLWRRASEEAKQEGHPDMVHLESKIASLREYTERVGRSYAERWPRPWPCGTVWLNWDPRRIEPVKYELDPSNGLFTLDLKCTNIENRSSTTQLAAFVDWASGLVSITTNAALELESVVYSPEVDGLHAAPFDLHHREVGPNLLPAPQTKASAGSQSAEFSNFQIFPAIGPTKDLPLPPKSDKDRNYSLFAQLGGHWFSRPAAASTDISLLPAQPQILQLDILVTTPRDILLNKLEAQAAASGHKAPISIPQTHVYSSDDLDTMNYARQQVHKLTTTDFTRRHQESEAHWREFWSHSAVRIENQQLDRIWYHNQYFLACCLRKHKVAPGLFANWSAGNIGTAWHGDYHADYNCQQVYWGVFSSNHADMHEPYIELCENLHGMAEKFAKDNFKLPGACFPLSSYPVPSQVIPYPVPPWAYQISLTPWTVQSLWWHYLYTQDENELRRVYPILRAAAQFVSAYVQKGSDHKYHFIPTVSSENWGFTTDFRLNRDCILDIALTQFLLDAVLAGSMILAVDEDERGRWREIRENLASYPTIESSYGEVWGDVVNAPANYVYNIPLTLAPVFPCEQVGIGLDESLELARITARAVRLEGGNDLVCQPLARARLGMLDLDWFIREVRYCTLPNGIANDRVRQSGGRYAQSANFDFMMLMGVWCENFSLPAVLNECMLQSYSGTIRLFPNTVNLGPARFRNLRSVGAFLVSADYDGRTVTNVSLFSEKGKAVRIVTPWRQKAIRVTRIRDNRQEPVRVEGEICSFATEAGETYDLVSA